LITPVYLHAAVSLGDRIYVIGGYQFNPDPLVSRAIPDVFSAKILGDGTLSGWEQESSLVGLAPNGTSAHAAVANEDHRCIYVIGGWLGLYDTSGSPHNKVFRACVQGNGKLGSWEIEPETLPLVPTGANGIYYHSAALVEDRVFVIGGTAYESGSPRPTDSVYIGRIDASGHLGDWEVCAHCLPGNLERHGMAVASNGILYIIGGTDRSSGSVYDTVLFTPLLDFEKHANTRGPVTYGNTISYTLKLTNLGVRDLEDLTITDTVEGDAPASFEFHDLPVGCQVYSGANNAITCTVSSLALGNTKDLNFGVTISQPTTSLFSAFNSGSLMPNCDADLRLEKSSDQALVVAGQVLSYTLHVHNDGPSEAQNIVVVDDLPDGVTFKSATPSPSGTNPLMWSWSSIPDNGSRPIRLVVQVDPGASGTLTNTAVVSSSGTSDPVPGNNRAEAWTVVVRQADLRIEKIDSTDPVTPGETLTYTLIITNEGPSDTQDVSVSDYLSPDLEVITTTPPTVSGPGSLNWHLDVPAGQSQEIQIVTTVDPDSRNLIHNMAIVSSGIDTDFSNNVAEEWTAIGSLADLRIEKISDPPLIVSAGGALTYTLWITNEGPSDATHVIVTDTLPAGVCGSVLSPPHCSGNPLRCDLGTVSAGEHEPIQMLATVCPSSTGTLLNRAEVRSDVPDSTPWNNEDQVQTAIGTLADLRLEMSRYPDLAIAGDTLTYTLEVVNDGPSDASGVIVTDTLPADTRFITATPPAIQHAGVVTWHISALSALPADRTRELELVVQTDPGSTDNLTNTAFVISSTPDDDLADNKAEDRAMVYAVADLSVDKESNLDRVAIGAKLIYTLQITNAGPSDASNVVVEDTLPAGVTLRSAVPAPTEASSSLLTWYTGTLAAGDVWTIVLTTVADSSARGLLLNTVRVSSDVPDPNLADRHDEEQTLAPVMVTNTAYICEDGRWCKESNTVVIYPCNVYLPVILKVSS